MKKILILLVLLLFIAVSFHPLSLLAKNEEPEKKHTANPDKPKFFQASQYLNFFYLLPVYPTLFFPDLRLNMMFLVNQFNFQPLKKTSIPKKRVGRAVLEGVGHFVYATASYWIRKDVMMEDWEYLFTWKDQKRRFFFLDGMRFDSNSFQFNWTHAMAGAIYYNYARTNRLNPLESFLFCFGASYFWEFVIEFREVVSINDVISTPMGGVSVGEALFQLGRLFRSKKPTFLNRIARLLSNPVLSFNEWLDRKKYKNQYAFKNDYWNDNRLFIGPRFDVFSGSDPGGFLQLGLESQINLIPEYGKPDVSSRVINHPAFTELNIGGVFCRKGLYEYNIFAKSVLFGYFIQDIHRPRVPHFNISDENHTAINNNAGVTGDDTETYGGGGNVGYSLFVGLATCFDLIEKDPVIAAEMTEQEGTGDSPDKMARYCIINLLGPTVDCSLFHKGLRVRFAVDAYGDFSLIHSYAFKKYSELYEFGQTKSTLENHDYYYALGVTFSSKLQVNYSNVELKGFFKYHYFDSVEGLDRFQKDMLEEDDFDLKDHRWWYNISLGYRIPNTSVRLVLGLERWDRKGYIGDLVQQSTERRSYFQIQYLF
ncbi:MAG: DUF3943 domain-containing protein [Candidatus Aminicenantes bacterium]|nr:MAG: DUF3943 domain-containing protein [Candidatus Aminicenantes bacterium]